MPNKPRTSYSHLNKALGVKWRVEYIDSSMESADGPADTVLHMQLINLI